MIWISFAYLEVIFVCLLASVFCGNSLLLLNSQIAAEHVNRFCILYFLLLWTINESHNWLFASFLNLESKKWTISSEKQSICFSHFSIFLSFLTDKFQKYATELRLATICTLFTEICVLISGRLFSLKNGCFYFFGKNVNSRSRNSLMISSPYFYMQKNHPIGCVFDPIFPWSFFTRLIQFPSWKIIITKNATLFLPAMSNSAKTFIGNCGTSLHVLLCICTINSSTDILVSANSATIQHTCWPIH